jgi:hypothetical protein
MVASTGPADIQLPDDALAGQAARWHILESLASTTPPSSTGFVGVEATDHLRTLACKAEVLLGVG